MKLSGSDCLAETVVDPGVAPEVLGDLRAVFFMEKQQGRTGEVIPISWTSCSNLVFCDYLPAKYCLDGFDPTIFIR